ncbi:MAG: hydrogenase maturation protease [Deltaproteobacteria bacterium]|nr:hydrogenase maturation protease [Deltaproteobacteria bacterium]
MERVLVLGYGNPGRLDDGLGPALVAALEVLDVPGLTVDADYQLMVEDAAALRDVDVVVFVDAATRGPAPFYVKRVMPQKLEIAFSSHSVEPEEVLALARDLFQASPEAYVVGIRGYDFDAFGEGLSAKAQENLEAAHEFLADVLCRGDIGRLRAREERVAIREVDEFSMPRG